MSYLDAPRLHFHGWFQADVSTINNDVRFFQNDSFVPEYQQLNTNGSWNPDGTGIFRLMDCVVSGGYLNGQPITAELHDPVIGMTLQNADQRAPGKLVDLDPQQQMVSQIWGMQVRLLDAAKNALLQGEYKPAAFSNLWLRQQKGVRMDQQLAANYQSVLHDVVWPTASGSALLQALQAATQDNMLSIEFNVYGYGRDATIPRYTLGHIAGTIGPYLSGEPKHFVLGRQMIAYTPTSFTQPAGGVYNLQGKLAPDASTLTLDFGNSFPIEDANSGLMNIGQVLVAVLNTNPGARLATVQSSQFTLIGEVPYLDAHWYPRTAGVQTFNLANNPGAQALLAGNPLVLLTPVAASTSYNVVLQESIEGLYVRADSFVYRIDPGETQAIDFYASQFGQPLADAAINISPTEGMMGGSGGGNTVQPPTRPRAAIPDIATPADAISYPASVTTNLSGQATLALAASAQGPGTPRGYISGQLYGLAYQLATQPPGYIPNPLNYVSILAYSAKEVPEHPTWYQDIQPLFTQYGNLYPIMSRYVVNLNDYASVVTRLKVLRLAFSLPQHDPNHMPVTRDLGAGDRATILKWLDNPGPDGLPLLGKPPVAPPPASPPQAATQATLPVAGTTEAGTPLAPLQGAGKTAVILQYEQRLRDIARDDTGGQP